METIRERAPTTSSVSIRSLSGGERKAAFRLKRLTAADIDGLYTEATLLTTGY